MKKLFIICLLFNFYLIAYSQPAVNTVFSMVSDGIVTFSGSNPYTATVNLFTDGTGHGYLATQIPEPSTLDTFRMIDDAGNVYQLTDISNATFYTIDIEVTPYGPTATTTPTGTILIYDPEGVERIPTQVTGAAGMTDKLQAAIHTWNSLTIDGEGGPDVSITSGTLPIATVNRSPDFGGNRLLLDNISNFQVDATGTYTLGDGLGGNVPSTDTDGSTKFFGIHNSTGQLRLLNILGHNPIIKGGAFIDGTDVGWRVGQLAINTATDDLYYVSTKSTDPDLSGTGSVFTKFNFGITTKTIDNLTSGNVTADVKRFGGTTTSISNPGAGIYTITIPADADIEYIHLEGNNTNLRPDNALEIRIDNSANSYDVSTQLQVFSLTNNQFQDLTTLGIIPSETFAGNITTLVFSGMNGFGSNGYSIKIQQ